MGFGKIAAKDNMSLELSEWLSEWLSEQPLVSVDPVILLKVGQ
jgi:hypothetical protein